MGGHSPYNRTVGKRFFIPVAILGAGLLIAAGVLAFSNFGDAAENALASLPQWTQQAGEGISVPACASANTVETCGDGAAVKTISWHSDGPQDAGCGEVTLRFYLANVAFAQTGYYDFPYSGTLVLNAGLFACNGSYTWTTASPNQTYVWEILRDSRGGATVYERGTFTTPNCNTSCVGATPSIDMGWEYPGGDAGWCADAIGCADPRGVDIYIVPSGGSYPVPPSPDPCPGGNATLCDASRHTGTLTWTGGASSQNYDYRIDWLQDRSPRNVLRSQSGSFTTPNCAPTGTIQGFKVVMPNNQNIEPAASQTVYLDGGSPTTANPYFFTNVSATNHTVSVAVPSGWSAGYTLCYNDTTCHGNAPTPGSSVTVSVPAGGYADLWWHYTPLPPSADIKVNNSDGPIAISSGASVNVTWCGPAPGTPCANADSCTVTFSDAGGSWSGTSGNQTQPLFATRTYTLACTGPGGPASDTATVNVSSPTLDVSLSANPNNQPSPLTTTLTADVTYTGNPADTINYSVWWNCSDPTTSVSAAESACGALPAASPGTCVAGGNGGKCTAVLSDPMSNFVPTYSANATAKVIAERGSLQKQAQTPITVTFSGGSCSASPTSVAAGQPVTWTATTPSGGSGTYTYVWHGHAPLEGLSGNPVQAIYITTGTKTGNVDISDGIQTVKRDCTTSVSVGPGVLNFSAVPSIISRGQSSTLFSSTAGYDSCTIDHGVGAVNPNGSDQRVVSPSSTTTYELRCRTTGAGGLDDRVTATVTVRGVPGFIEIPP